MDYEWDPAKAAANFKKHGVRFADAALSLEDPLGFSIPDPDTSGEAGALLMPFDAFVQQNIFDPLKMTSSFWTVPKSQVGRFATNYIFTREAMAAIGRPADPGLRKACSPLSSVM